MKRRLKQWYVKLVRSPGAPEEIAGGFGLGLFVAMLPIMGIQMPVAVVLAEILRRTTGVKWSRLAAAAGVWLTNPLTAVPLYGLAYLVGRPFAGLVLSGHLATAVSTQAAGEFAQSGGSIGLEAVIALIVGGVILGIPFGLVGRWAALRVVRRYQARRAARRARVRPVAAPLVASQPANTLSS